MRFQEQRILCISRQKMRTLIRNFIRLASDVSRETFSTRRKKVKQCLSTKSSEKINVSHNTIERHLKVLRESGYVERVGARKDGHWSVKI